MDESGCNRRVGHRRCGWAPLGVAPIQVTAYRREQRWQILPAYTQDGILLARVFQGSTTAAVFEDFIRELLKSCGKFPEPKSVIVMDNASFYCIPRITQICADAGVIVMRSPPYCPPLNPIEECFAELKAFIRKNWHKYEEHQEQGFESYLNWCMNVVGSRESSAKGHFRNSEIIVEEP